MEQVKINKIIKVDLLGMRSDKAGDFREVEVPVQQLDRNDIEVSLEAVFVYGQNMYQPLNKRSISTGDVIHYNEEKYLVKGIGFDNITNEYDEYIKGDDNYRFFRTNN